MICFSCGEGFGEGEPGGAVLPSAACDSCGHNPFLDGRYCLLDVLGHGASGSTYRASRLSDGLLCCVKELSYARLISFDDERHFKRETKMLRELDHPAIPGYLDDFIAGQGRRVSLYVVQELVDGETLAQEMEGRRYDEQAVLTVAIELFDILTYLHELSPPVVHRDIKPANVMRRREGGQLALIDFGAVKEVVCDAASELTVSGTYGYMAPEGFFGQAEPKSDLYSVGVLMVVLLSGCSPDQMMGDEGDLIWQESVMVSRLTDALLVSLLDSRLEHRMESAKKAAQGARNALTALLDPAVDTAGMLSSKWQMQRTSRATEEANLFVDNFENASALPDDLSGLDDSEIEAIQRPNQKLYLNIAKVLFVLFWIAWAIFLIRG